MRKIRLTQGKYALVDDADFDRLSQWKWRVTTAGYAVRSERVGKKILAVYMHRVVNKTPQGKLTDHIDGNRLNNRKSNLRSCSHSQNMWNNRSKVRCRAKVRGVIWDKAAKKWHVTLRKDGVTYHFGSYINIKNAKKARRDAEIEMLGKFAPI